MKVSLIHREYFLFVAFLIVALNKVIYSQGIFFADFQNKNLKLFHKNNKPFQLNKQTGFTNFFPLNSNDFLEYIERDTTVFRTSVQDYQGLNYTAIREVIGDTLMSNSMTYKILKWSKCANSVNEPPQFEYLRKDINGNVYIFFNNKDNLLYDFDRNVGDTYDSQYAGFKWKLLNKYTVTGFGSQHNAIDLGLIDSNNVIKRKETLTEDFGLTYYRGDINVNSGLPEGSFFGAIINDSTYGYLLAKRQQIDWKEFYPLHVGNFWKYEGNEGQFETTKYVWAVKDTLLSDNNIYTKIYYESFGGPYPGKGSYFKRVISTTGEVFEWNSSDSTSIRNQKFSACLGDTFSNFPNYFYLIEDKNNEIINYSLYPDLVPQIYYFKRGLGEVRLLGEGYNENLVGAVIDGKVYGDTTISGIEENINIIPSEFKLYQNYPNPFNPNTVIRWQLAAGSKVTLEVYDVLGKKIKTLTNEYYNQGNYSVSFNAVGLPSGIYFYRIVSKDFIQTKKMILLR